jgi:predicted DNA-binding transcriptional regulator YafY
MVCANEQHYLVCNYDAHDQISHYRIDRIKDIEIVQENIKPLPKGFDVQSYTDQSVYMFGGKAETVTLKCDNNILDNVLDKFGIGIRIRPNDGEIFFASFKAAPYGVKFWALQYLPYCEVTEPKWLRDEITQSIRSNKYQEEA